jgi:hypothetical protein
MPGAATAGVHGTTDQTAASATRVSSARATQNAGSLSNNRSSSRGYADRLDTAAGDADKAKIRPDDGNDDQDQK